MSAHEQNGVLLDVDGSDHTCLSTALPVGPIFSKQAMTEAIAHLSKFLDPTPSDSDKIPFDYSKFSVLIKSKDEFIQDFLLKGSVTSPEMMLLVIESITRSGDAVKKSVFRFDKENKMSGGKVIFVKWLAYALNRIEERYKAGDIPGEDEARVEEMIADSIIELIRSFTVIYKEKQLDVLANKFGVDWDVIVQKTIEFASSQKIDSLLESCKRAQEHLKNIKKGTIQPYEPRPLPAKLTRTPKELILSQKQVVEIIVDDDESMDKNGDVNLENHNDSSSKSDGEVSEHFDNNTALESKVVERTKVVDDFELNNQRTSTYAPPTPQDWTGSTAGARSVDSRIAQLAKKINTGGWDTFTSSVDSGSGSNERDVDAVKVNNVISTKSSHSSKVSTGGWENYTLESHSNSCKERNNSAQSSTFEDYNFDKSKVSNGITSATNGSLNERHVEDVPSRNVDDLSVSRGYESYDKRSLSSVENGDRFLSRESIDSDDHRKRRNYDSGGKSTQKRIRTTYDAMDSGSDRPRNQGRGKDKTLPAWMTKEQAVPSISNMDNPSNNVGRGRGRGRELTLPAWKTKQDQVVYAGNKETFSSFDNEGRERVNGETVAFQFFDAKSRKQNGGNGYSNLQECPSKQQHYDSNPVSENPRFYNSQIPQEPIRYDAAQKVSLGRGRGRTLPAWMTSENSGHISSAVPSFHETSNSDINYSNEPKQHSGMGRNLGRGRGRDQTLPAWMTKKPL